MNTESLKGKVALVTGGAGGIGRATCLALAAEGAAVAVMDIDLAGGESVAEELQDLGATAGAFATDVSDYDATKSALARIRESLGEPLIVVCNAGIAGEPVLFRSEDKANWQRLFQVHVDGAYHCIRETINPMLAAGWGRIVCISSVAAQMGWRGGASYAAAKGALIGLVRTLALEYAAKGVTANAVLPGVIDTAMSREALSHVRERVEAAIPMGRIGQPKTSRRLSPTSARTVGAISPANSSVPMAVCGFREMAAAAADRNRNGTASQQGQPIVSDRAVAVTPRHLTWLHSRA